MDIADTNKFNYAPIKFYNGCAVFLLTTEDYTMKNRSLYPILATLLLAGAPFGTWAATCISSSSHPLTAAECEYAALQHTYPGFDITDPKHSRFTGIEFIETDSDEIEDFGSTFTGTVINPPGMPGVTLQVTLMGPVQTIMYGKAGFTTGTFATEIIAMSLSGNIGPMPIQVRESTTIQSLGQTTITDLGGGEWQIDSFFDVFTELSVDGGEHWTPSLGSTRMTLQAVPIPAPLILFGSALGLLGLRRKRRLVA